MSGRGIADLRAKFENKNNDTSPPSRGRSPAGQESVIGSEKRKVRTSFISVERSGQMGPSADRESIDSIEDHKVGTDGANDTRAGVNAEEKVLPPTTKPSNIEDGQHEPGDKSKESTSVNNDSNGPLAPEEASVQDAVNPDKPSTAGEDDAPIMQPSDPKDEVAVSGGAALAPKGESLGALLKGSEFEEGEELENPSPQKPVASGNPTTPKKTRTPQKVNNGQSNTASMAKMNGSPRSEPESTRSTPLKKSLVDKPATVSPSINGNLMPSPKAPLSPTTIKKSPREPIQQTASPKQNKQSKGTTQPSEADNKRTSTRTLTSPLKAAEPAKSTASSGKPVTSSGSTSDPKNPKPTSPKTVKPKAKSPTRPIRLPGAATAMTTASAAKNGSTAPPQPSNRASLSNSMKASTLSKPAGPKAPPKPAPPVAPGLRNKAPRSSLPPSSAAPKPKPRTSTASKNAAGGDFLARMMRPTQASASKTHEKVEQKTPPKKRVSSRPKRISDGDSKQAESKSVPPEPTAEHEKPIQNGSALEHQPQAEESVKSDKMESTAEGTDTPQEANIRPSAEKPAESNIGGTSTHASDPVSVQ
ncbi:MAG: hypothetical protein LQ343_007693 [Gyalolechia ehrenbergii]|nr:MAG: hypothetical protein LQ343_007693 [Gyalolechia ehrenbergii]